MASATSRTRRDRFAALDALVSRPANASRRVLIACSSGGHLAQAMTLEPWWTGVERLWVTFDTPDAVSLLEAESTVWCYRPTTRNVPNLIRNLWLAWKVMRHYRPDMVLSTGAAIAFPFFVLAKLSRVATCYVEVYDRISTRTLTGRLCRPLSDLFLVQWPEQVGLYRDAQLIGTLL